MTAKGLYCRAGDFYIDPNGKVETAVVTHAHSDHARRGSQKYYCARSGVGLLRERLGKNICVQALDYGTQYRFGESLVSLHPAGHILGSAQVRIETHGEVWVASGDYKRDPDPTCEPFETVICDVFVTEATFGTPTYKWNKSAQIGEEIFTWWQANSKRGINSVLFAYSLGKAQRVLGLLQPFLERTGKYPIRQPGGPAKDPQPEEKPGQRIFCHPAATPLNECYLRQGIRLAPTICLGSVADTERFQGELFLVPGAFMKSPQAKILGSKYETAFASGWMSKPQSGFGIGAERGFVLSDHADWPDLVRTVQETEAKRVYVQHRGQGALVRHLRSLGLMAFSASELYAKNPDQMAFF